MLPAAVALAAADIGAVIVFEVFVGAPSAMSRPSLLLGGAFGSKGFPARQAETIAALGLGVMSAAIVGVAAKTGEYAQPLVLLLDAGEVGERGQDALDALIVPIPALPLKDAFAAMAGVDLVAEPFEVRPLQVIGHGQSPQ